MRQPAAGVKNVKMAMTAHHSYTLAMVSNNEPDSVVEQIGVSDRSSGNRRPTTQLERSFGPSCLLSLIIVLLMLVVVKRFVSVSWPVLGCLTVAVWLGVLALLIRWRPDVVEYEE